MSRKVSSFGVNIFAVREAFFSPPTAEKLKMLFSSASLLTLSSDTRYSVLTELKANRKIILLPLPISAWNENCGLTLGDLCFPELQERENLSMRQVGREAERQLSASTSVDVKGRESSEQTLRLPIWNPPGRFSPSERIYPEHQAFRSTQRSTDPSPASRGGSAKRSSMCEGMLKKSKIGRRGAAASFFNSEKTARISASHGDTQSCGGKRKCSSMIEAG